MEPNCATRPTTFNSLLNCPLTSPESSRGPMSSQESRVVSLSCQEIREHRRIRCKWVVHTPTQITSPVCLTQEDLLARASNQAPLLCETLVTAAQRFLTWDNAAVIVRLLHLTESQVTSKIIDLQPLLFKLIVMICYDNLPWNS